MLPTRFLGFRRQVVHANLQRLARLFDRLGHKTDPRAGLGNFQAAARLGEPGEVQRARRVSRGGIALQAVQGSAAGRQKLGRVRRGQQHRAGNGVQPVRAAVIGLVFFQNHVEIGAAKAKRADPCPARDSIFRADPRAGFGIDVKGCIRDIKFWVGPGDVDGRRQHLVIQRQGRFDQAGCSGGGLGVPDLRLYAAQRDVLLARVVFAKDLVDPLKLRRVSGYRAGAVRLDQPHGGRGKTGFRVGAPHGFGLPGWARGVDALEAAIAGRADGLDDRIDAVAVALGVSQALEHDHAQPFANHHPARLGVKCAHVFAARECGGFAEAHEGVDGVVGIHAAGNHHIGAAFDQLGCGHTHRRQ